MDNLFNVNQAAFILKVHPLTIRRYIKEGKLKGFKLGGNVRIKEPDLADFQKEITPPPQQSPVFRKNQPLPKVFDVNDPLFRLRGLGAGITLSKE